MTGPDWGRIPAALRQRKCWCIAGPDKAPYFLTAQGTLAHARVDNPQTYASFDSVVRTAQTHSNQQTKFGVGYVCQAADPFTCIDLDYKDAESHPDKPEVWTTPSQVARSWALVRAFDSYTERSRSGKGLHIWVGGKIGEGARRENVEIYSQLRFIICTGDVVTEKDITEGQALLDELLQQVRQAQQVTIALLEEFEEANSDQDIIERAVAASNSGKFNQLCRGEWEHMGFPSQSEADLALLSMFTFYSPSNTQCRRLFRMSALGKRDKATKDNRYLDLTLGLIRGRQKREAKIDADRAEQGRALAKQLMEGATAPAQATQPAARAPSNESNVALPVAAPAQAANEELYVETGLPWPPGFAGELARFIYHSAPRPVKEVAIVATIGLLAGICGRAYTIPQSGLNIYVILVARSAIGKEAMHSGISHLMKFAQNAVPQSIHFVDFNDYVSGQALVKRCAEVQSFVNVAGEWGRKLKRLASEEGKEGPMQSLRTAMTNLYQKSGPQSIVGGLSYSNKENNVASVSGVAFSMIGETTPNTFYEALTEGMMSDGFLSRFTVIEYSGERPLTNPKQVTELTDDVKNHFGNLLVQALMLNTHGRHHAVLRNKEAEQIGNAFDKECDDNIRGKDDESHRQMWNRAHLKVLRLAALLACADNCLNPMIDAGHMNWALTVVRADIAMMTKRMASGDVGQDDTSRERKLLDVTREFFNKKSESYGTPDGMMEAGVVTRKYLQIRCARLASFSSHRLGATSALDMALRSLCDSGYFVELPKDKAAEAFGFHGKCYRVLELTASKFAPKPKGLNL
jgi:hypothetical protein